MANALRMMFELGAGPSAPTGSSRLAGGGVALQAQQMFAQMALQSVPALTMQRQAILGINAALVSAQGPMMQFSRAMGKSIEQAIEYKKSVGKAMEAAVKATLESLAGRAIAQAIYSTGLGFLDLAEGNFPGAALAFEAAAAFGAVGAATAAMPGGGRAAGRGSSGRYSAGSGGRGSQNAEMSGQPAGGYDAQGGAGSSSTPGSALATGASLSAQPSGGLTVSIMGNEEAGQWLATTLNRAVTQQGVQLVASGSQRGAPVGH